MAGTETLFDQQDLLPLRLPELTEKVRSRLEKMQVSHGFYVSEPSQPHQETTHHLYLVLRDERASFEIVTTLTQGEQENIVICAFYNFHEGYTIQVGIEPPSGTINQFVCRSGNKELCPENWQEFVQKVMQDLLQAKNYELWTQVEFDRRLSQRQLSLEWAALRRR